MRRTIREKEPPKPSTRLTQELVAADAGGGFWREKRLRLVTSAATAFATVLELALSSVRLGLWRMIRQPKITGTLQNRTRCVL